MLWVFKYIPLVRPLLQNPPRCLVNLLSHEARSVFEFLHQIDAQLDEILANPHALLGDNSQRETIYHHLMGFSNKTDTDSQSPMQQKRKYTSKVLDRESLLQEAESLLLAGSDTVGHACNVGFFHILDNQDVLQRLTSELDLVWPDQDSEILSSTLEKLPYLVSSLFQYIEVETYGHNSY
jgi:cytochrome P450